MLYFLQHSYAVLKFYNNIGSIFSVGPVLTEFRIDQMTFGQPECTCLNIQNIPLLQNHADSVNPKFGQSGVYLFLQQPKCKRIKTIGGYLLPSDDQLIEMKGIGFRHNSVDLSAPSILPPGFESQARRLFFQQFIKSCYVEKTKINQKRPGLFRNTGIRFESFIVRKNFSRQKVLEKRIFQD